MPRDGSGVYTLPAGNPVAAGTTIQSTWANNTMSDMATQMNNVVTRDGTLGPTGQFKVSDGTLGTPSIGFNSEPGLGFYRGGSAIIYWSAQSQIIMGVNSNTANLTTLQVLPRVAGTSVLQLQKDPSGTPNTNIFQMVQEPTLSRIRTLGVGTNERQKIVYEAQSHQFLGPNNICPPGMLGHFLLQNPPEGWIACHGGTIGNASSGASNRAAADTWPLFEAWWNNFSNATLPIYLASGANSIRGASALADFNEGKRLTVFNLTTRFARAWGGAVAIGGQYTESLGVHTHGVNDPSHAHGVADPGHAHGVYDPGHNHGVNDPGHAHTYVGPGEIQLGAGVGFNVANNNVARGTNASGTGIWLNASGSNIGIYGAATGIGIYGAGTGISIQNGGAGDNRPINYGVLVCAKL